MKKLFVIIAILLCISGISEARIYNSSLAKSVNTTGTSLAPNESFVLISLTNDYHILKAGCWSQAYVPNDVDLMISYPCLSGTCLINAYYGAGVFNVVGPGDVLIKNTGQYTIIFPSYPYFNYCLGEIIE